MREIVGSLDSIVGNIVVGWASSASGEGGAVDVELLVDGRVVGYAITSIYRADVEAAGLDPVAGFKAMLAADPWGGGNRTVTARVAKTGQMLSGSLRLQRPAFASNWPDRPILASPAPPPGLTLSSEPISIVIRPLGECDLERAIGAIRAQTDPYWELFVIGNADVPTAIVDQDPRIRMIRTSDRLEQDLQAALAEASGGYLLLLDCGAILEPEAVGHFRLATVDGADLIYGDEALVGKDERLCGTRVCPAFSHDLFVAAPFFGSCYLVSAATIDAVPADNSAERTSDHVFILHVLERSARISHVPALLCRVPAVCSYPPAPAEEVAAHLRRVNRPATVAAGPANGIWRIDYRDEGGRVLVVIPTKDSAGLVRQCIESVRRTTVREEVDIVIVDHDSRDPEAIAYFRSLEGDVRLLPYSGEFNFAAINNHAVARAASDHRFVLLMNNDVEALRPGWLEHLRGLSGRRDVGVAAATLLYGNGAIQHGGVIVGLFGTADHSHKHLALDYGGNRLPGYLGSMAATRDYSAVTGACMMLRTEVFKGVGGFDERLAVDYNDLDLCLRIRSIGLKVLLDAHAVLLHHESATRSPKAHPSLPLATRMVHERWRELLATGDPFYHPLLSLSVTDHAIERLVGMPRSRTSRLWAPAKPYHDGRAEVIDRLHMGLAPA